jgi:hypothetical protein
MTTNNEVITEHTKQMEMVDVFARVLKGQDISSFLSGIESVIFRNND